MTYGFPHLMVRQQHDGVYFVLEYFCCWGYDIPNGCEFGEHEVGWVLMPTCFEDLPRDILWKIYEYAGLEEEDQINPTLITDLRMRALIPRRKRKRF